MQPCSLSSYYGERKGAGLFLCTFHLLLCHYAVVSCVCVLNTALLLFVSPLSSALPSAVDGWSLNDSSSEQLPSIHGTLALAPESEGFRSDFWARSSSPRTGLRVA